MRNSKVLSCLIAVALAFGIAIAGAGCLVTAFGLVPVDMATVISVSMLCAAVCGVCFSTKRVWWLPALPAALLIGYLIRVGTQLLELEALLFKISQYYNLAYGWETVGWSGEELGHIPVTGGLAFVSAVITAVVAWVVCRRGSAFWAVAIGFLPMAACFVVTDTIPQVGWVFLLLTCLGLLVLTQSVRKRDPQGAVRLTAMLLVPVVLASNLLFWLNPREGYDMRLKTAQQTLLSWFRDLPFVVTTPEGELTISVDGLPSAQMDLTTVGPKYELSYSVMDVTAEKGGVIYLRGQSFDAYDGLSWSASQISTGEDSYFPSEGMKENGRIDISVRSFQGRRYVPYYIPDKYVFTDGYIVNEGREREYSFTCMELLSSQRGHLSVRPNASDPIIQQCLRLPEETRVKASQMLNAADIATTLDGGVYFSNLSLVQEIKNFVSNAARYDLNTPQMPQEEQDFALWFLEESDTGYCVHFASAAAVLLRAAGIPARYVTGYMFEAESGQRTTVRSNAAHAWVEYFDPYNGWSVMDATPAEWMEEQEETEPTEPAPIVTEPPTEPVTEPEPTMDTTESTETNDPEPTEDQTAPLDTGKKVDFTLLWTAMKYFLPVAGVIVVIAGQYRLRAGLRRKKMRTGHPNKKALARWRYAIRMSQLTKIALPEELETLAEKAKFSQHILTAQELKKFDAWLQQAKVALSNKPWIVRFAIKLIWAIE